MSSEYLTIQQAGAIGVNEMSRHALSLQLHAACSSPANKPAAALHPTTLDLNHDKSIYGSAIASSHLSAI